MNRFKKLVLFVVLSVISWQAHAGWEITYRNTDSDGMISYDVMLIEDNMIKSSGNDAGFVFDVKSGEFIWLIAESKQYWKGNIKAFKVELEKSMKQVLNEMLQSLPQDQRAMYEQMLGGMSEMYATPTDQQIKAVNLKVVKTSESVEIAGYSAAKYELFVEEKLVEQLWISDGLDVTDDLDTREMAEMFNAIRPSIDTEVWFEYSEEYLQLLEKGFMMKSVDSSRDEIEVIKVDERKIGKDEFEVPADYSVITIEEIMQQQMMQGSGGSDGNYDDND